MALIECKKCGKSFSDTLDACIHCGAPLKEDESSKNEKTSELISFDKLDSIRKLRLESEFVNGNKGAFKQKKRTTSDKFATFVMIFTILFFVSYFFLNIFLFVGEDEGIISFDSGFVDDTLAAVSLVLACASVLTALLWKITESIIILINKNSIKKYIYMKEFQKWLLEEKNIEYIPVFNRDSQKEIFDKIDLTCMKL